MSSKLNIRELCDLADKEIKRDKYDIELPASIIESFARFLVPEIRKYYGSEQGQQEFAEWQEAQKQNADAERP